jgi:hypothetical protein
VVLCTVKNLVVEWKLSARSFSWWLVAGADLILEKSIVRWLLVAGLFCEKSTAG